MTPREEYIHKRLMELACITDSRALDLVEKEEEKRLIEELKKFAEER